MLCTNWRKDVFSNEIAHAKGSQMESLRHPSTISLGYDFFDEYPSAYHPPPLSLKVQEEIIFIAFLRHLGHLMDSVPILTNFSVTVPSAHLNSYTGILKPLGCYLGFNIIHIIHYVKMCYSKNDMCKGSGHRLFYPYGFTIDFYLRWV